MSSKKTVQRQGFKTSESVVYPSHGVGKIIDIEEQEVAGMKMELFVIHFEKDKMTLKVPVMKAESVGMRADLARLWQQRFAGAREVEFGDVVLRQDKGPDHSPILVASVDDSIIKGHNDIYRPAFIDFLRWFIMLSAEQGRDETAPETAGP